MGGNLSALLLSGGIESTALAYWLRPSLAITVDYGQPCAGAEVRAARVVAERLSIKHECITVSLYAPRELLPFPPSEAHSVWWAYRNQLLLTLAAIAIAERRIPEIVIGLVKGDIYKDCTDEFVRTVNRLFDLQERPVKVLAPARRLTTLELLQKSQIPYELLGVTTSCHVGELACGLCAGCQKSRGVKAKYKVLVS